ncbi:MAG: ABC-F family ATP-binding cassette domain-containing protein, partial [Anaerolineales bacterium]|nr:ABC-F family ATP-binding cassette domain-containing protein [Anaerolineales bacterium]
DEPTNHLDIPSQETLQAVLTDYPGTILLVSHDRYLINALSSQIWEIDVNEEDLIVYEGNYQAYQSDQGEKKLPDEEINLEDETSDAYKDRKSAKNLALAADRQRAARLREVETRITDLEVLLEDIGESLIVPPEDADEVARLGKDYRDAEKELELLLKEWENLQE